jgi:hypothetical protein
MAYQSAAVGVSVAEDQLRIYDLESAELIATPPLSTEKGRIFKNTHHYRDHQQRLQDLEQGLRTRLGEVVGERLCAVLKTTSPRIYQEQLVAVARLLDQQEVIARELMARLAARSELTATTLKRYLEAEQRARERGRTEPSVALAGNGLEGAVLRPYALLGSPGGRSSGQEVKP